MFSHTSQRMFVFTLLVLNPALGFAQPAATAKKPAGKKKVVLPKIAETPVTVDPATLMPKPLATKATVSFEDKSLAEIAKWIQDTQKIAVLFDKQALSDAAVPLSELVTDRLKDEPVYLLLNRLRSLNLAWYVEDNIVHITSLEAAWRQMSTKTYNIGDLLDAKFKRGDLHLTIKAGTGGIWAEDDPDNGET
ncbi:MAG: hypothetical protein Tsb009_08980 [Planctomycetaceae bacterium]